MTATATMNGKSPRKQLDRLDTIIDALAAGLNQAVADACREGTRLAVKDVLVEVMTNPELRALIGPQAMPTAPAPATPGDLPDAAAGVVRETLAGDEFMRRFRRSVRVVVREFPELNAVRVSLNR